MPEQPQYFPQPETNPAAFAVARTMLNRWRLDPEHLHRVEVYRDQTPQGLDNVAPSARVGHALQQMRLAHTRVEVARMAQLARTVEPSGWYGFTTEEDKRLASLTPTPVEDVTSPAVEPTTTPRTLTFRLDIIGGQVELIDEPGEVVTTGDEDPQQRRSSRSLRDAFALSRQLRREQAAVRQTSEVQYRPATGVEIDQLRRQVAAYRQILQQERAKLPPDASPQEVLNALDNVAFAVTQAEARLHSALTNGISLENFGFAGDDDALGDIAEKMGRQTWLGHEEGDQQD